MQEKIRFTPPPSPASIEGKTPQSSQVLFTKVMNYLEALAEQEKLEVILKAAKQLQHTQVQVTLDASLAKGKVAEPEAELIWKKVLQELENGKSLLPLLKQLPASLQNKDFQGLAKHLQDISSFLLTSEESPISPDMQEALEDMLAPMLEQEGGEGEKAPRGLLLKNFLGDRLSLLKNKGLSNSEILKSLLGKMEKESNATPPTLFSETAKALLSQMKGKGGEQFLNELLQEASTGELAVKNNALLANLLKGVLKEKDSLALLSAGVKSFEDIASKKQAYTNFRGAMKIFMATKHGKAATQGSVQKELAFLQQLLQELEKYDPNDPQIQQYAALIAKISQDPQLTSQDLQDLTSAIQGIFAIISSKVPSSGQQAFLKQLEHMLKGMISDNGDNISQFQALLKQVDAQLSYVDGVSNDVNTIQAILKELAEGHPLSTSDIQKLTAALSDMMSKYNSLSPNEQKEIMDLFGQLAKIQTSSGVPLGKATGDGFTVNPQFFSALQSGGTISPQSLQEALQGAASTSAFFEKDYITLQEQSESLNITIDGLKKLGGLFGDAKQAVDGASFSGGSLPDDFANAILGHYMPQQEAYLMALASMLFFFNFGANMDNIFLRDISDWSNAGVNYNFANWYNSGGNKDTQGQIDGQISNEISQANQDKNEAEQLQADLEKKLAEIAALYKEGKLTTKQANALTSQIDKKLAGVNQAISNLDNVIRDLKCGQTYIDSGQPIPPNEVAQIQKDEKTVAQGDTNNNGFGGLETIYSDISNEQTEWSSQSQQQQIVLQMRMTQIQQEWTVVATAMQMLNQMYMTPAQAIYK